MGKGDGERGLSRGHGEKSGPTRALTTAGMSAAPCVPDSKRVWFELLWSHFSVPGGGFPADTLAWGVMINVLGMRGWLSQPRRLPRRELLSHVRAPWTPMHNLRAEGLSWTRGYTSDVTGLTRAAGGGEWEPGECVRAGVPPTALEGPSHMLPIPPSPVR